MKKKGLASANKKANRIAAEGVIETYIHAGANLGVLIEVNCETDFVAKGEVFKELAANLAMQVSCPHLPSWCSVLKLPWCFVFALFRRRPLHTCTLLTLQKFSCCLVRIVPAWHSCLVWE